MTTIIIISLSVIFTVILIGVFTSGKKVKPKEYLSDDIIPLEHIYKISEFDIKTRENYTRLGANGTIYLDERRKHQTTIDTNLNNNEEIYLTPKDNILRDTLLWAAAVNNQQETDSTPTYHYSPPSHHYSHDHGNSHSSHSSGSDHSYSSDSSSYDSGSYSDSGSSDSGSSD